MQIEQPKMRGEGRGENTIYYGQAGDLNPGLEIHSQSLLTTQLPEMNLSATSHSDVQYTESLRTIRHYAMTMKPTNCPL